MDFVADSGMILAFGVPQEEVYTGFNFKKLFLRNIQLVSWQTAHGNNADDA